MCWSILGPSIRASWRPFQEALVSEVADTKDHDPRGHPPGCHGQHRAYPAPLLRGLKVHGEVLWLRPLLPAELTGLRFNVMSRRNDLVIDIDVDCCRLRVKAGPRRARPC
jgi:hypothetical protein